MATATDIVKKAESYLGYKEGSGNKNQFSTMMGRPAEAWCADFVCAVFKMCNALDLITNSASCGVMIRGAKNNGTWHSGSSGIKKGDLVYFDFDRDGEQDHVGICYSATTYYVSCIEGNTSSGTSGSQSNGDGVYKRTRNKKYVLGFIRPKYDGETVKQEEVKVTVELTQLSKGSKGTQVKTLQRLLISNGYSCGRAGVDGDFGNSTFSAVKAYQRDHHLSIDGICGKNTWNKILKG